MFKTIGGHLMYFLPQIIFGGCFFSAGKCSRTFIVSKIMAVSVNLLFCSILIGLKLNIVCDIDFFWGWKL